MKRIKTAVAILCVIATVCTSLVFIANAANSGQSNAGVLKDGQTLYVTTNDKWNANLPGGFFNTIAKITIPVLYRDLFTENGIGKLQVTTFKKTAKGWVMQNKLSGQYYCNPYSGVLTRTFRLPGRAAQYKIVITPDDNCSTTDIFGIRVDLTNNGVVDTVA